MAVSSDEPPREPSREGFDDTVPVKDTAANEPEPKRSQPPERPSRSSSPTTPPPPGQERYQISQVELGRGGMGRVVEAFDTQLGRKVALKEVLPKAGNASQRRFDREVSLTAMLEHPSIVPLYDSGKTPDGRPYYVMRRVTGRPLDELIMRSRKLDERLALLPAVQSAINAIAHAHSRGVIHRDLKPANILVGEFGETIVIDWGLAKVVGEDDDPASRDSLPSDSLQTQMGSVFGTPGFMAPEQARGEEMTTQGDVYALGATLYQLLAGTPPHSGASATDVIDKTLRHHMIPLTEIAPGAPAELVTIVNKALSAEPEMRYPHAKALGEDIERFLTGQLVAAHRYTTTQRFVRFAKKHRTALAVAALAIVALTVLAWISIKSIIHERDAAKAARAVAVEERKAAVAANAELEKRHDALLVSRARARIDQNPTEALATLKELKPTSTQIDEARAVAQAAILRGVTWAIQSTLELTLIAEMSPDASQLLQVSRDGMVRVWDLERRELELARPFPTLTRAIWIAGGRALITHPQASPAILEPRANIVENMTLAPMAFAFASANGEKVVFQGEAGAGVFDVATRTVKLFTTGKADEVAISPDGTVFSYTENKTTFVVDGDGKELARMPEAMRVEISSARTVAALADNRIYELDLNAPKPAFKEIEGPGGRRDLIVNMMYRERELIVMTGKRAFWAWDGTRAYERGKLEQITGNMGIADKDFMLMLTTDNKVHFIERGMQGSVQLPANLEHTRLVARADASRVLVIARGMILGFDLETIRPRIVDIPIMATTDFVDDDTLIVAHSVQRSWHWVDATTGKKTKIDLDILGPFGIESIDSSGRVLVSEGTAKGRRITLLRKNNTKPEVLAEGEGAWGTLVPGNAIVYGKGDSRVMAIIDGAAPREIARVTGNSDVGIAIGHRKVAVHSSEGELLKIDLGTLAVERTTISMAPLFFLAAEPTSGKLLIAEGNRVLMWDGVVTQLATFDRPISSIGMLQNALAVALQDNETYLVELVPNVQPRRVFPSGRQRPVASADGRLLVSVGNAEQIDVLELPVRTRWTVPQYYNLRNRGVIVSPTKRRLLQHAGDQLVIWQLPLSPAADFGAWLEEQTNAKIDTDGEFIWPWQKPNPK